MAQQNRRRILVVDDSRLIRELARVGLETVGGWQVTPVESGGEALEVAAAEAPEAVLPDVVMPDMDGPETLAALRAAPATREIPVVDDQFTVRELQRSILEAAGYRVETVRDRLEALARIARDSDIDIVLTDVQMPNMDGFELLQAIRRQPEHSSLPVAIVTSRSREEDRRRGVDEGADAYIVKREFDQKALLETIGNLVRSGGNGQ